MGNGDGTIVTTPKTLHGAQIIARSSNVVYAADQVKNEFFTHQRIRTDWPWRRKSTAAEGLSWGTENENETRIERTTLPHHGIIPTSRSPPPTKISPNGGS